MPGSSFFYAGMGRWALTTDVGGWRWGGWKMGLWIFLSWNRIFDWKYFPKSVNFTFSLPFLKVKLVVKWSFAWKYDGSAVRNWNNDPVSSLCSRYNLTRYSIFGKWSKWFPLPLSTGLERVVEIPILPTKQRNLPPVSFRGNRRQPLALISGKPDDGASNEVSSLANEKVISSRNRYGAKGKAVLVSVGVFSHQIGSPTLHSGVLGCT